MVDIITILLADYGAVAAIIGALLGANIFFVWRGIRREDRMQKQIDTLHKEMRDSFVPLLTECKEVIKQNSQVLLKLIEGRANGRGQ